MDKKRQMLLFSPHGFSTGIHTSPVFFFFCSVALFSILRMSSIFITCIFSPCRLVLTLRVRGDRWLFLRRRLLIERLRVTIWEVTRVVSRFFFTGIGWCNPTRLFTRLKPEVTALKTGSRLDRNLSYFMAWLAYRCAFINVWIPHGKISSSGRACVLLWGFGRVQGGTVVWC